jgi:site-specific DNA-cytosine methylase
VFLVASLESDRAAEVLLECEGCKRHPSPRWTQRQGVASGARDGSGIASTLQAHYAKWVDSEGAGGNQLVIGTEADSNRVRAADGLAGRLDDQPVLVGSLTGGGLDSPQSERIFGTDGQAPTIDTGRAVPTVFRKSARAQTNEDSETWVEGDVANTLNSFDVGDVRTTHAIVGGTEDEDDLLPVGLDSHRYRCCGNGVVAPVAEWIGRRIVEVDRRWREEGK